MFLCCRYSSSSSTPSAPFNAPFNLVLNLAVGGYFPGFTIDNTATTWDYYIDYIRVYDLVAGTR